MAKKRGNDYGTPRKRGFDDDIEYNSSRRKDNKRGGGFSGGGDQFGSISMSPAFAAASAGPTVVATVSWYNSEKGFGFVALANGGGDAFLHVSVLESVGFKSVNPGTEIKCRTGKGLKGQQVQEILEIDESKAATAAKTPRSDRPSSANSAAGNSRDRSAVDPSSAIEVNGIVKWYSVEKGFGFVSTNDGFKDVFVHASALQRCNIESLEPDCSVKMKVIDCDKGREALTVELA